MSIPVCLSVVALAGAALLLPSAAADDLVCAEATVNGTTHHDSCEPNMSGICATPVDTTGTRVLACVANP